MFRFSILDEALIDRICRWEDLKRWERREIGQMLRRLGLSYREISAVIPVHKGTLSGWCADLDVPRVNRARIGTRQLVGARMRQRTLDRYAAIRAEARRGAEAFLSDPFWVAGVVAYWSEGAKRSKQIRFSNSDPSMIMLFVRWAERYLDTSREDFAVQLHLHAGQDEQSAIAYWSDLTGIPRQRFLKTYVKPEGSGHRKNVLYRGTATVRVPRSTELLHTVLAWADAVADRYALGYPAAGR